MGSDSPKLRERARSLYIQGYAPEEIASQIGGTRTQIEAWARDLQWDAARAEEDARVAAEAKAIAEETAALDQADSRIAKVAEALDGVIVRLLSSKGAGISAADVKLLTSALEQAQRVRHRAEAAKGRRRDRGSTRDRQEP